MAAEMMHAKRTDAFHNVSKLLNGYTGAALVKYLERLFDVFRRIALLQSPRHDLQQFLCQ